VDGKELKGLAQAKFSLWRGLNVTPNSLIAASCSVTIALLISYGYLYLAERKSYILTWIISLSLLLIAYLSESS
jgi:hypothetical protein